MTYRLLRAGLGFATEQSPLPDLGKVRFTFVGEKADTLCVCGRFYPIVGGVAEIPTEGLPEAIAVSAYSMSEGRRYLCDPLLRVGGEAGSKTAFLIPAPDGDKEVLALLSDRIAGLEERLLHAERALAEHSKKISGNIITFGGYHET